MRNNIPLQVDKQFILSHLSEEEIFHKYLNVIPNEEDFFTNPLRSDANPSCKFFYGDRTKRLWFIDFARSTSYDCFNVVQTIYRCNFYKACEQIAIDFNLLNIKSDLKPIAQQTLVERKEKEQTILRCKAKKYYPKEHLAFWQQFDLPLTSKELINELLVGGIRPAEQLWIQVGEVLKTIYRYDRQNIAFVYDLDTMEYSYEFYIPFNKEPYPRHIHSTNNTLHYYHNLPLDGDYVVITKSRKDAFLMKQFGIVCCALMTERKTPSKEIMDDLTARFDKVFTLLDRDRAGYERSIDMRNRYRTIPLFFTREDKKDFADNLLVWGYDKMNQLIEQVKELYDL